MHPVFAGVGTISDTLLSEGNNSQLKLQGTRTLGSGVVILSYDLGGPVE